MTVDRKVYWTLRGMAAFYTFAILLVIFRLVTGW